MTKRETPNIEDIRKIISSINFDVKDNEDRILFKKFLESVHYFSKEYMDYKKSAEEYIFQFMYLYEKSKLDSPYFIKNYKIFNHINCHEFKNNVSHLLNELASNINNPELSSLDRNYIFEVKECVISLYNFRLNEILTTEDLFVPDIENELEEFIKERIIEQKDMIWLYNMYKNESYVYATKKIDIYNYSWSDGIEDSFEEDILYNVSTGNEKLLEDAESELPDLIFNTYNLIFEEIFELFIKKYSDSKILYNKLTNNGTQFNFCNIESANESEAMWAIKKWMRNEFNINVK